MKPANKQFSEELGLTFIIVVLIGVALKSFGLLPFPWYGLLIFGTSAILGGMLVATIWILLIILSRYIIDKWKESKLIKKVKKKFRKF